MSDTARCYTVRDVAVRYEVREHQVLGWIRSGHLRAVDVSSRPGTGRPSWRIMPDALCEFESARSAQVPAKSARRQRQRARDAGFVRYFS